RRRHTRWPRDWSSDVCSSDLGVPPWTTDFTPMPVFPPSNAPTLRIVSVGGIAVPTDPGGGIQTTDTTINTGQQVSVAIEARNIQIGRASCRERMEYRRDEHSH